MCLAKCEDVFIHPDVFVAESPATSPVASFRLTSHAERDVRLAPASRCAAQAARKPVRPTT